MLSDVSFSTPGRERIILVSVPGWVKEWDIEKKRDWYTTEKHHVNLDLTEPKFCRV